MAIITGIGAGHVGGILAGGSHPVMTGGATTQHFRMVHPGRRHPQGGDMAGLAHVGALDMGVALAGGRYTVVTAGAITRDAHVIKIRR